MFRWQLSGHLLEILKQAQAPLNRRLETIIAPILTVLHYISNNITELDDR